jgi:hypothetical protein
VNDDEEPTEGEKNIATFIGLLIGLSAFAWLLYGMGYIQ